MKEKDLLILSILRRNAREKLTSISRITKVPVSTIFDRLIKQQNTIIKKHTALIDFAKLGFHTHAHVIIKVRKDDREILKDFVMENKNVNTAYKINNGYDFLLDVFFRDMKELQDFMEAMEEKIKIQTRQVHYIIDELKREEFLSNPDKILISKK